LITRQHTTASGLSSKMPVLNYSVTHNIHHSYPSCMASGWLEDRTTILLL